MLARLIYLSAAIVASAATIVLARGGPLTAQSARMELRKIADNRPG